MTQPLFFHSMLATLLVAVVSTPVFAQDEAPSQTIFRDVNVFDGMNEELVMGTDVLVEGNLIKSVGAAIQATAGATVIDGGGRTLMPGLMDMHVHFSLFRPVGVMRDELTELEIGALGAARAENWLMTGFTTVRDTCGASAHVQRLIDKWKVLPGPRILSAEACITQTSGHADFRERADRNPNMYGTGATHWMEQQFAYIADGKTEIRRAIRENFRRGAAFIKIMSTGGVSSQFDGIHTVQYSPEEIRVAVETAAQWGTYVTAHGIAPEGARQAVENGVQCLEHGAGIDEKTVKLMKKKGVWLVPSFWVLQGMSDEQGKKVLDALSYVKWKKAVGGFDNSMRLAVKYDLKMAFGTDMLPMPDGMLENDATSLREFAYIEKYMAPWQVLRMATGNAGELAALSGPQSPYQEGLGMVHEGYYADLLLVDGDPTKNLSLMSDRANFKIIMKDGVIYKNTL